MIIYFIIEVKYLILPHEIFSGNLKRNITLA